MRTAQFSVPIYGLPPKPAGKLPARAEIEAGAGWPWPVLYWASDPIDVFVMHIQGSGLLRLRNGRRVRVGYAGNNGHDYRSIGRLMVDRGLIDRKSASMQSIVAWLRANPEERQAILNHNPRFIFFRKLKSTGPGPIGAEGISLTPGRSLAVDPAYIAYGTPVWVSTTLPGEPAEPFRRLMVAQDTGGAIRGPVRGDIFFGAGTAALEIAGRMKSGGSWYVLLPR